MEDDTLANCLKPFWDAESIGISELTTNKEVKDELFEINIKRIRERYSVKLTWNVDRKPFSNCFPLCNSHLQSLHHRLRKDSSLWLNMTRLFTTKLKWDRRESAGQRIG